MNKFYYSMLSYDEVFTYDNLLSAYDKCCRTGIWKTPVINYDLFKCINLHELYLLLKNREYEVDDYTDFLLMERGKLRHIKAPSFRDRIVQRCLCDNYLVPLLTRGLIYDNTATIKGRGTEFALMRLSYHLRDFYSKYKTNGYILIFDFKDYFNSINHDILYNNILDPIIIDDDLRNIIHLFIDSCGNIGLGLGSQISQICAVSFPNIIDHTFKDKCGLKYYGRYMDDGYIILNSREEVNYYKNILFSLCDILDLNISENKIKIIPLYKRFTFLKHKFYYNDSGNLKIKLNKQSIIRMKRKLIKFLNNDKMTYDDVKLSYLSWRGSALKYTDLNTIDLVDHMFNYLYITNFYKSYYNNHI